MRLDFAAILFSLLAGLALLANPPGLEARSASREDDRLNNSALVMKEAMGMQSGIPQSLLERAFCVIVIPSVIKGAFGVGGSYGRGAMSCRSGENFKGPWTPPSMMALEGVSFGFQAGGQATDFVLLVMNSRGARSILSGKVKIGGDAAASAGPIGRNMQANLDIFMRTTILSYSRSRGLFAGASLEGSTLRPDNRANRNLYRKDVSAKSIVIDGAVPTPASAERLISTLNQYGKSPAATTASVHTAPPPTPNRPPVGTCFADPVQVVSGSGDTVSVRADASDPDNDPLTYTWTATVGTIEGSGSQVRWNPAGAVAGPYSINVRVDDGRGGSVSCVAQVFVVSRPQTMSCSASPSSVHAGDRVHITASPSNPNNDPLTFTWESGGGRVIGSGAEVDLDTTGVKPSRYEVTGQATDGRGGNAECRAEFNVEAPRTAE